MIELEPLLLEIPLEAPLPSPPGPPPLSTLPLALVRVSSDEDTAYGEALVDPLVLPAAVDFFADTLANSRPRDYGLLWERLVALLREYRPEPAAGYSAVMGAIDTALWDLAARELGVPCYRLAGGARARRVDCYASGLVAAAPDLADRTRQLRRTFGAVQLTLGGELAADLAAIKAVRRAAGDEAPLLVDAGGLYSELEPVRALGALLEQVEAFWFEAPLPAGRWEDYHSLRQALATPLAADRRLSSLKPYSRALHAGALDIVVADLRLCGGMSAGQHLADLACLHETRVTFHTASSPLAQVAAAHLIVAHSDAGPMQVQPLASPLAEMLQPAPVFRDGFLLLPEEHGLGARVCEDFLDRYRVELERPDDE